MSPVKLVTTKPPLSTNSFRVVGLVVVGVCLAAIAAHLQLVNSSEDATGLLAVLDHTFDLILALGLSVLILLAGRGVAQRFDLEFVSAAEEISFSFFLGTGVVGLSVLCLGLLGLLRPWPVGLLLAFYTAMTVRGVPPIYKAIKKGLRATTLTRESRVVAALFLCLLAILILRTTTTPNTADELIYHLPVTKQFVRQG